MILGIGTDIVDMRRIQKFYDAQGQDFLNRFFTPYEQAYGLKRSLRTEKSETSLAMQAFSKLFAAKEAMIKAIGVTDNMQWHDMEIQHHDTGKPFITLKGAALVNARSLLTADHHSIHTHLSLADDTPFAIAYVILETRSV